MIKNNLAYLDEWEPDEKDGDDDDLHTTFIKIQTVDNGWIMWAEDSDGNEYQEVYPVERPTKLLAAIKLHLGIGNGKET